MRTTVSRMQDQHAPGVMSTPPHAVPSIRLVAATPSNAGSSFESNVSSPTFHVPQASSLPAVPETILAPSPAPRKRLVPKKSKLGLLGGTAKAKERDLTDIVRRVGAAPESARGGFEVFVDPTEDPDIGEIVMVKKKKSRVALDSIFGDATNAPAPVHGLPAKKQSTGPMGLLKRSTGAASVLKSEDENQQKWWTIGRGRKDSKPKAKAETPKTSNRFNSLDSGILLNSPITSDLPAELQAITESQSSNAATLTFARAPKAKPSSIGRSISFGPATALTSPLEPAPQIMKAHSMVPTGDNTGCVASPPPILRASSLAPVGNNTGLLAPPPSAPKDTNASNSGSIAVRAMRSMKSLATISSWAQLKDGSVRGVPKEKAPKETADPKPAKTKVKAKKGKKAKADTLRVASGSSFEAGALSVPEIPAAQAQSERVKEKDLGERKRSVLGLGMGWPSTLRSASSPVPPSPVVTVSAPLPEPEVSAPVQRPPPSAFASQRISSTEPKRLSGESNISTSSPEGNVAVTVGRSRAGSRSTMSSTTSSLRPLSTASGHSAGSCGSSAVSIRWDEEGLATVKEARERDRATRRGPRGESRRGSEERRRTSLTSVFPETAEHIRPASRQDKDDEDEAPMMPTVNIETATTVDGHSIREEIESDYEQDDSSSMTRTPNKLPRPRPLSEQLLRQMRPRGITSDSEGALSILDAATNELASLIGRLDLEATPTTPDLSPLRAASLSSLLQSVTASQASSKNGSPVKSKLADSPLKRPAQLLRGLSADSVTSLRPYAQAKTSTEPAATVSRSPFSGNSEHPTLGQHIAPWPVLNNSISPGRPRVPSQVKPLLRPKHQRTPTPQENDAPVLQALRPPTHRALSPRPLPQATPPSQRAPAMPHGSATFGRQAAAKLSFAAESDVSASPTPVFIRPGHARKRSSLVPASPQTTVRAAKDVKPLAPSVLDLFGGGVIRASPARVERSESDIPADLLDLIAGRAVLDEDSGEESGASLSDVPPSPGAPPVLPLPTPMCVPTLPPLSLDVPVFRLYDEEQRLSDIDPLSPITSDDENTKKSFEFTEELKRLNASSDRHSFVEQLESAFQTPAKIDILYGLGGFLAADAPPVPKLPAGLDEKLALAAALGPDSFMDSTPESSSSEFATENSILSSSEQELNVDSSLEVARAPEPARSDGELNRHFKFGGRPSPSSVPSSVANTSAQLTLSDILPSPEHVRRISMASVEDCGLSSMFDNALQPSPASERERTESDSTTKRRERNLALSALTGGVAVACAVPTKVADASFRPTSQVSFAGFDSFDDVRRNFEFGPDRPVFYPAPGAAVSKHRIQDSVFSVASVSSYGSAFDSGSADPFGYSAPSRPQSMSDMSFSFSMSGTVDDTFRFIKQGNQFVRSRVDSDASTFSFHAPASGARMPIYTRPTHRRDQSTASISSMAPPVSLYNRGFGHRRNMSNGSASSIALSYALHGAAGGRAAWARHRPTMSIDSAISEVSALGVARPGVGDKMFASAPMGDFGVPLSAISASPSASEAGDDYSEYLSEYASGYPYSFLNAEARPTDADSIFDATAFRSSGVEDSLFEKTDRKTGTVEDSIFQKTGYKSPIAEDSSIFGGSEEDGSFMPSVRPFRPVSVLSTGSEHPSRHEDDTMISMIGGGHVRRMSIGSIIEGSPCVRVGREKRVKAVMKGVNLADRLASMREASEEPESMPRIVEKPSVASIQFGNDRMEQARKGMLKRQSLEIGCLSADGEDTSLSATEQVISFRRPTRANRARSNTYASSGTETPPLSAADNSSVSGGSESSIDVSHLTMLLANMSHPSSNLGFTRSRPRVRGHRRRISQARASRSSIIETIEEEHSAVLGVPPQLDAIAASPARTANLSNANQSVVIVDSDADSRRSSLEWDPNHGLSLRRYYALKDEANDVVQDSKRVWNDTPFSLFALQAFDPPRHPDGMKAMLEHSQLNYHELPSMRRLRSRTSSRASPYARAALVAGVSPSSLSGHSREASVESLAEVLPAALSFATRAQVLQPVFVHTNSASPAKSTKSGKGKKAVKPVHDENTAAVRPRVNSNARRSALGWVKRVPKSSTQKENVNTSAGSLMNPNESLRITRPRPRGRPTPALTIRA